jgi:Fe-S-cluster containining protein
MENDLIPLAIDDRFRFACGPDVPCFNACCRDLNQFLTPYDILRLKNRLKLASGEFLSRFTATHLGPQTGLPVVSLKAVPDDDLRCPFVCEAGCQVYEDRPSSCRTYPLARAVTRSRETGALTEHFALMREDHCSGCEQSRTQTVKEWIAAQELDRYNHFNDMLMDVISLKNQFHPGPLDMRAQRMFAMALYDVDGFREHLKAHGVPDALAVSADREAVLTLDDEALLTFGHTWLKWALFKEAPPS